MNAKSPKPEAAPKKIVPAYLVADLDALENAYYFTRTFSDKIFELFAVQSNVYHYALDLMYFSKNFARGRTCTMFHSIIESLKQWCKQNDVHHQLTLELKILAVNRVLEQANGCFVQLICDTFKVKDDYQYFKFVIKDTLNEHKFKEAFYLMCALDAEKDFTLEEFAFPVFFLDKEPWVKSFLKKRPELQLKFVQTLDSICLSGNDIQNFIRSLPYLNLSVLRHVYDPSRLQKLLANYIDQFDIDPKQCKHLYQTRCGSAMSYLVRKRYKEESIGSEAFQEMVLCVTADNIELQRALLMKVVCHNDSETALKLAEDFNLERNDWPEILQNASASDQESQMSCFSVTNRIDYLKFRLDRSDIYLIDTPEKFKDAIADISENYDVVGTDAEWRPNLGIIKENLSIYQLAVWDAVYLFDILALKKSCNKTLFVQFVEKIFCNKNILKLGYGSKNDVHLLLSLCHEKEASSPKLQRMLDLCEFFKKVKISYPLVMDKLESPPAVDNHGYIPSKGLTQLCYTILGRPLNKDEQFSDWERRPLRETQIMYAALDAFCLLLMYEKLYHVIQELNLDLEEVIKTASLASKSESPKKEKKQSKKDVNRRRTPVSQFKVVVDNMINGVGKYLRICGADVVFIGNNDDHMKTVKVSQLENRVILTAGAPYQKISGYVPENMIFCVPVEETARDQASIILKHFNVHCTEADIFSRCSVCSSSLYKQVSSKELFYLWSTLVDTSRDSAEEAERVKHSIPAKERFLSEDGVLESGVPIQLSALTPKVFDTVNFFFICTGCGKVYWEGSHFSRVKKHISKFIEVAGSPEGNVYQCSGPAAETAAKILSQLDEDVSGPKSQLTNTDAEIPFARKNFMSFDVASDDDDEEIDDIVISFN